MPPEPNNFTLRLGGDLTSGNAASAQAIAAFLQAANAGDRPWRDINFDLTAAKMIDSAGLNLLVAALKAAQKGGGKMQVTYRDPNIERTLRFTGLDKRLELVRA